MPDPLFLRTYHKISEDKLPSRYKLLKTIPVTTNMELPERELWKLHDEYMESYREDKKSVYTRENKILGNCEGKNLLDLKIKLADSIIEKCHLCQHRCGVNRKLGEKGFCKLTDTSRYAAEFLHMGEEPELVPSHTIFLTGCVFSCVYCQNWDISMHPETGRVIDSKELAGIADMRRKQGAKNLNFVTPTPHLHTILKIVKELSVNTPIIWNSNMYHSPEAAKLLEGVVDVYLADFKYGNDDCALKYSKVHNYMKTVTSNLEYASNDAEILMRHLVLPGHTECCTRNIVDWTSAKIPEIRFNLMFQYRPEYLARNHPEINRSLTIQEREKAIKFVKDAGLRDVLL